MKLYFFRGFHTNFGDELNPWLVPKLLPGVLDENEDEMLLAIGSILFDHHPKDAKKIVFGSGYGGYTPPPKLDEKWQVYCVRGPRSAAACGLGPEAVAGDTAILIARHWRNSFPKTIPVSFMPHYQSIGRGFWERVCKLAGVHFLNPRLPVEQVLEEICRSQMVITEAMHGAIVSDALRVPWVAITPVDATHRMKWYDWAEALDVSLRPHTLPPSSVREARLALSGKDDWFEKPTGLVKLAVRSVDLGFVAAAAAGLARARRIEPQLSSDAALDRVLDKLQTNAERILADHRPVDG
ncbi:polysaccharide pyruvyl transferase family protein [Aureimonas leprariae]|uniref:Polysaccharide pyruvyl transferase family protein n=1 Tax=Plantimonas leprariae TaxID=2615207 RepID=A0A7V7TWR5_9HYPH|nr:polysaccharide pyruvyl transferase family protein [Aureimonas leprariae]KAB0680293.1 polysaccharide pyruvyl transferase family protein [Aureimonas leprariae]